MAQTKSAAFKDLGGYALPGIYQWKFTVGVADMNTVATTGDTILLCNIPAKGFQNKVFYKHSVVPAAPSLTTNTCTVGTATTQGASLNLQTAVGPTVSVATTTPGVKEADPSIVTPFYMVFNFAGATAGTFTAGSIDVDLTLEIEP